MEYTPTKTGFPSQRKVLNAFKNKITFPLKGSAPQGFWNHKLEFGAEVISLYPPTAGFCISDALEAVPAYFSESRSPCGLRGAASLKRRAFNIANLKESSFPIPFFWGEDVAVSILYGFPDPHVYLRHADSHTVCFVREGSGIVETDFGLLSFTEGDFIFLPRGTTYLFMSNKRVAILFYEFTARIMRPFHYWIDGYPFTPSSIRAAEPNDLVYLLNPLTKDKMYDVYVKKHIGHWSRLQYPFSPCVVAAWEGELYPFVLPLQDIRTLSSPNFHLDPKAFTIFVTEDESASIQAFLPRWIHSRPYPHQNYCTEVLFNHRGYGARSQVGEGCLTLHPPGTFHGPDVISDEHARKEIFLWRDEVAVMLEARSSLIVLPSAESCEISEYDKMWYRQYQESIKK